MQTETKMAIATMIDATSALNRSLEVVIVNIADTRITPEPTQEVKKPELYIAGQRCHTRISRPAMWILAEGQLCHRDVAHPSVDFTPATYRRGRVGSKVPLGASLTASRVSGTAGPACGVL